MILLDVTPHALGIMTFGGYFEELIPQNTTVPTSRTKIFTTSRDNQTAVKILVMQGETRTRRGERAARRVHPHRPAPRAEGRGRDRGHLRDQRRRHRQRAREGSRDRPGAVDPGHRDERPDARTRSSNMMDDAQGLHGRAPHGRGVRGGQAGGREADRARSSGCSPRSSRSSPSSDFGRDAIGKAARCLEHAREAIEARGAAQIRQHVDGLARTQRMFKGVVSRAQ